MTLRELSQIIGSLVLDSSGVRFSVNYYSRLEILGIKVLKSSKGQWDSFILVCTQIQED